MAIPKRLLKQTGRFARVDGIPYALPVNSDNAAVIMAAFPANYEIARSLLPGNEVHPVRLLNGKAVFLVTVVDYRKTDIGKYIEYSIALACTHGSRPAPKLLPALFIKSYQTGQYILDLPVSTEISVKGGKGIWGMPKHQANLDFIEGLDLISAQYDLEGEMVMRLDVNRPSGLKLPINMGAANYCQFRGMLMKSYIYFKGKASITLNKKNAASVTFGNHPKATILKNLQVENQPLFTAYIPKATGVLDDYFESWFLSYPQLPTTGPEGLESVIDLGLGEEWLENPNRMRVTKPQIAGA
ncbi:acetoacetate decarboxylase family protein [Adhaeribacter radiodurans]|uniref:Acetoacetate decarboxylase family protein n=1 Tax=Adhaeribacter radiodurans TaxID=2745197 RepID=A0A7L7LBW8_9BACT|nr:acetoacetate decarboxylase family protein [Adhaeribacter radiodurans]QMU29879.1 acetoacetate decarboxylase family protein [Adhaeribacter radiodurans]